ncbi:MAG: pilin [bacterium]|nr:pilin [bacterium]
MKKFLQQLKMRSHNVLYAAFVPLAGTGYDKSPKLKALFSNDQNLVTYLNTLFTMAITVGAIIAVLRLLFAGYMYMASDVFTSKEKAKEIFREVFLGLFLLLSIFIILKQINPNLLNLDVTLAPITLPATAPPGAGACSVAPLSAIVDPLAQQMETGGGVIWQNTNPRLRCAANQLVALSGGGIITSAYRPQSYQTHLFEISDRWCTKGLRANTDPACGSIKSAVAAEVSKHFGSNWNCGSVAQSNSTHGSGTGVDISGANQLLAAQACLIWRNYPGDPWHYDLNTSCTTVCNNP